MGDSPKGKRHKGNNAIIENFLKWCKHGGLLVNPKVIVQEAGSCHRFGMIALEQIEEGECIFKIPRDILLQPSTSSISKILVELEKEAKNFKRHGWQPLLICLLHEYTNPVSKWRPYLDLVPTEDELNQAIFWNNGEIEILDMIDMRDQTKNDIKRIEKQYINDVLPFIKENPEYFDPDIHTLQLYKRLSGFVMAYSFTDNEPEEGTSEISMVPMADILNHITDNNAHLEYGDDYLTMIATKTIEKGLCLKPGFHIIMVGDRWQSKSLTIAEDLSLCHYDKGNEVYNTYGNLDNEQLLCQYGFIEKCPNSYDEVEIPFGVLQEILGISNEEWKIMMDRVNEEHPELCNTGVTFDCRGCLCCEDDFFGLFGVIHKDEERENERWIHVEDEARPNSPELDNVVKAALENPEQFIENNFPDDEKVEKVDANGENDSEEEIDDNEGSEDYIEELSQQFQPFNELVCLKEPWRITLSRAAEVCSRKMTDKLTKFQSNSYEGQSAKRKAMVEEIVHGHLTIFKQIQQLYRN